MLDTVAIAKVLRKPPDADVLIARGWRWSQRQNKWLHNDRPQPGEPCLTLFLARDNAFRLLAEVSLPHMLFGSNINLPSPLDIEDGLRLLSDYVTQTSDVEFDAFTADVYRADFAMNLKVDELAVIPAIATLARLNLPYCQRRTIEDTSVYFESKGKQKTKRIRIYDKHNDVLKHKNARPEHIEQAKGIIRIEHSVLSRKGILRMVNRYKLENSKAVSVLNESVASRVLRQLEQNLRLDALDRIRLSRTQILIKEYGVSKAMQLRNM